MVTLIRSEVTSQRKCILSEIINSLQSKFRHKLQCQFPDVCQFYKDYFSAMSDYMHLGACSRKVFRVINPEIASEAIVGSNLATSLTRVSLRH